MNLFEFIDKVFGDEKEFRKLTVMDKEKNFFMFNRMMGIKYPQMANYINHQNVNKSAIIEFWRHFILTYVSPEKPKFLYTKAKNKPPKEYWEPKDKEMYMKYLDFYQYTRKDFQDASLLDLDATKKSFRDFKKKMK